MYTYINLYVSHVLKPIVYKWALGLFPDLS